MQEIEAEHIKVEARLSDKKTVESSYVSFSNVLTDILAFDNLTVLSEVT